MTLTTLGFLPPCRSCSCSSWKVMAMARRKKPNSSSSTSSNKGSAPTPPRITSNVKQNLQYIKLWKEYQTNKSSTPPRPSTSYRRKKLEKEELPKDTELDKDPTMNLDNTNQDLDTGVPVLLVDGYNVCGYWPKLKKHFSNGRLEIARRLLIDELRFLSEIKVVVVFDAMKSGQPTRKQTFAGMDLIFSSYMDADSWIEKEVVALKEDGCPVVWVATDDHWEQQAALGLGALVWSCNTLISEIKAARKELDDVLHDLRSTSVKEHLLKHNLPPEVVDSLRDLRTKLSKNGMPHP